MKDERKEGSVLLITCGCRTQTQTPSQQNPTTTKPRLWFTVHSHAIISWSCASERSKNSLHGLISSDRTTWQDRTSWQERRRTPDRIASHRRTTVYIAKVAIYEGLGLSLGLGKGEAVRLCKCGPAWVGSIFFNLWSCATVHTTSNRYSGALVFEVIRSVRSNGE